MWAKIEFKNKKGILTAQYYILPGVFRHVHALSHATV